MKFTLYNWITFSRPYMVKCFMPKKADGAKSHMYVAIKCCTLKNFGSNKPWWIGTQNTFGGEYIGRLGIYTSKSQQIKLWWIDYQPPNLPKFFSTRYCESGLLCHKNSSFVVNLQALRVWYLTSFNLSVQYSIHLHGIHYGGCYNHLVIHTQGTAWHHQSCLRFFKHMTSNYKLKLHG